MSNRIRACAELVLGFGLFEWDVWCLRGRSGVLHAATLAALALLLLASRARRGGMPIATRPRPRALSWNEAALATVLLGTIAFVAGAALQRPIDSPIALPLSLPDVAAWGWLGQRFALALGQQLVLQRFLAPVCIEIAGSRALGLLLASIVFGAAHLPSAALAVATTLAGLLWLGLFARAGRWAPIVVSHFLLSLGMQAVVPERLHSGMAVGRAGAEARRHADRLMAEEPLFLRLASREFFEASGANEKGLLAALFRETLGRAPNALEAELWGERLRAEGRASIVRELVAARVATAARPAGDP